MSQHRASSLGQGFLLPPPPILQHLHPSSKKRLSFCSLTKAMTGAGSSCPVPWIWLCKVRALHPPPPSYPQPLSLALPPACPSAQLAV